MFKFARIIQLGGVQIARKNILFILATLIIVSLLVWYKIPNEIEKKYSASTVDGTTVELSIQMKAYHNFFSPTDYRGTIAVNNVVYKTVKLQRDNNLFERLNMKIRGAQYYLLLRRVENGGRLAHNDSLYVIRNGSEFNKLHIFLHDKDFFAPAEKPSEAIELQIESK
ncbi:hypothetical protein ACF3MZ_17735 [Paenibacillaceae bacterium WGS1546]|uniref:hypothetical protein n=1 Tax=Cohnella sp. WGS1546 TaxID=3366810 RepID=UPI00372CEFDD